jgi:DNA-binding beta-propeller fold protein YncE
MVLAVYPAVAETPGDLDNGEGSFARRGVSMAGSRRRTRFRDQTLGGILLGMARAMLAGPSDRSVRARAATPRRAVPLAGLDDDASSGSHPVPAARSSMPLLLGAIALIVIAAVAASIFILVQLLGSANQGTQPISIPGSSTATPAGPSTPPPVSSPLAVPPGTPLTAAHVYGGSAPALLDSPEEAIRLKDGHIYVADTGNHRVAVFDAKGRLLRSITSRLNGSLLAPFSLAVTPQGHLLVLDSEAGAVIEYDAAGTPLRESSQSLSLGHARGIAVDAKGDVLVADPAANAVYTLSSDFTLVHTEAASAGAAAHLFDQPSAVAVAPNGAIFVMDNQNSRIEQFSPAWQLQFTYPLVPSDTQHSPRMLPLADGRLLATDPPDGKLLLFGASTAQPQAFSLAGPPAVTPCIALGLAADRLPAVLVTCNGSGRVLQVRVPGL